MLARVRDGSCTNTNKMPSPAPRRRPSSHWLVYLLRCSDGSLYCGSTNDLPRRLKAHSAGKASRYTRSRLPVRLAYQEPQPDKSQALRREAAIKRLPKRAKLDLARNHRPARPSK